MSLLMLKSWKMFIKKSRGGILNAIHMVRISLRFPLLDDVNAYELSRFFAFTSVTIEDSPPIALSILSHRSKVENRTETRPCEQYT